MVGWLSLSHSKKVSDSTLLQQLRPFCVEILLVSGVCRSEVSSPSHSSSPSITSACLRINLSTSVRRSGVSVRSGGHTQSLPPPLLSLPLLSRLYSLHMALDTNLRETKSETKGEGRNNADYRNYAPEDRFGADSHLTVDCYVHPAYLSFVESNLFREREKRDFLVRGGAYARGLLLVLLLLLTLLGEFFGSVPEKSAARGVKKKQKKEREECERRKERKETCLIVDFTRGSGGEGAAVAGGGLKENSRGTNRRRSSSRRRSGVSAERGCGRKHMASDHERGPAALSPHKAKELDSMKESISTSSTSCRTSTRPPVLLAFLDLDTQIVMARVRQPRVVRGGAALALPLRLRVTPSWSRWHWQPQQESPPKLPAAPPSTTTLSPKPPPQRTLRVLHLCSTFSSTLSSLRPSRHPSSENCTSTPRHDSLPNGTDTPREPGDLLSPGRLRQPLIGPDTAARTGERGAEQRVRPQRRKEEKQETGEGCCCCRCKCCQNARVPAFFSVLDLCCALWTHVCAVLPRPAQTAEVSDVTSRLVFTLCCCAVASVPILLAMLVGALCQFCSGSLDFHDSSTRRSLQQAFISSSLEMLLLYGLNMLILSALLPDQYLMMVPVMAVMFVLGRLVYWVSLNICSPWRGFGSGLTVFPLLAAVALNLFLMYNTLNTKQSLFGS
ncbi:hypothetical protein WMY93_024509 [Mugilogobius chulae]|uniref:Transmembrane protein 79 n=1 Tax=Mugilogobius chulae TaxID=88201 RepID=A0AAW0N5E1_9GOBI